MNAAAFSRVLPIITAILAVVTYLESYLLTGGENLLVLEVLFEHNAASHNGGEL